MSQAWRWFWVPFLWASTTVSRFPFFPTVPTPFIVTNRTEYMRAALVFINKIFANYTSLQASRIWVLYLQVILNGLIAWKIIMFEQKTPVADLGSTFTASILVMIVNFNALYAPRTGAIFLILIPMFHFNFFFCFIRIKIPLAKITS